MDVRPNGEVPPLHGVCRGFESLRIYKMARGKSCVCHRHDSLVPIEVHHVWPQQYHGPDTEENLIDTCANAHSDIHYLLNAMLKGKPYDLREYGPMVRHYAKRGYDDIMAYCESLIP